MALEIIGQVRVLVVGDHELTRAAFRCLIESAFRLEVIQEAPHGKEALAAAMHHQPDVILVDVIAPLAATLESVRGLREQCGDARIIAVSADASFQIVNQILSAGSLGFVTKNSSPHVLH